LTAEQVQRDPVYVRIPISGVDSQPFELFGPQIDGGQMPPQLIEWDQAVRGTQEVRGGQVPAAIVAAETNGGVWNHAEAQIQAEEEHHLIQLQVTAAVEQYNPVLALADVLPPRTIETAFAGAGVLGGRAYGNGCIIYSYVDFADYLMSLDTPVVWPTESALIIDSSAGSIVCRASQLLVKGYSAADFRLVLNITGWDLQANMGLPDCMMVNNPVFPISSELRAIAVRDEDGEAWWNTQTGRIIDTNLTGDYLLLRGSGKPARRPVARTSGC
jgi:hypothetical protein